MNSMPKATYTTRQGDMLDLIAFNYYGSTLNGQTEAIMKANQVLDLGQYLTLPVGLVITLPAFAPTSNPVIQLF